MRKEVAVMVDSGNSVRGRVSTDSEGNVKILKNCGRVTVFTAVEWAEKLSWGQELWIVIDEALEDTCCRCAEVMECKFVAAGSA